MLATKIILTVVSLVFLVVAERFFAKKKLKYFTSILGLFLLSSVALWVTVYYTNYNGYFFSKILLYIAICLMVFAYRHSHSFYDWNHVTKVLTGISIIFGIVWLVSFVIVAFIQFNTYWGNFVDCEDPTITISTTNIIGANDTFSVTGNMSGGLFYTTGSISEELVYYYYYKNENGDIVSGHIPAEETKIILIRQGEGIPRVEAITTTPCQTDYNVTPPEHILKTGLATTTYKLYVPDGSVLDEFIFDLEK